MLGLEGTGTIATATVDTLSYTCSLPYKWTVLRDLALVRGSLAPVVTALTWTQPRDAFPQCQDQRKTSGKSDRGSGGLVDPIPIMSTA